MSSQLQTNLLNAINITKQLETEANSILDLNDSTDNANLDSLKDKMDSISTELTEKLIPGNIKKGVTIFNVEGVITPGEEPNLPYIELEYIQSTGTQYIDTGVKMNSNNTILTQFQSVAPNDGTDKKYFGVDYSPYVHVGQLTEQGRL